MLGIYEIGKSNYRTETVFYTKVSKRLYHLKVARSQGLTQTFVQTQRTPTAEYRKHGCQSWWHGRVTRGAFKNPKAQDLPKTK